MKRALMLVALMGGCGDSAVAPPGGADLSEGPCGRGFVVVHSDYASTSVSILHADGRVAQPHFISSASAPVGLSAPLSGDVVVPSRRLSGEEVVLIDRRPAAIITWVTIASGMVRAQLDVGTGFAANPQDYLLFGDRAYLSRYDQNPSPGREPFDEGSDVLVIDPERPAVVGRIDLSPALTDAPGFLPRPNRMARLGDRLIVIASAYDALFASAAPSRIVTIDPSLAVVVDSYVLEGLHGCGALATRDDRLEIAVGCTGAFGGDSDPDPSTSGVVLLALEPDGSFRERARWGAAELGRPAGFGLAFAEDGGLYTTTLGSELEATIDDRLVAIDPLADSVTEHWRGRPFSLGEIQCATSLGGPDPGACGPCFVADADAGAVQRLEAGETTAIRIDDGIGLPPRYLGRL